MSNPKRPAFVKQNSKTSLEQSLNIISSPHVAAITIYPGPNSDMANLSKADLEIAQRLHNLKYGHMSIPSEEEMAARLAQLKGLPEDHFSKTSYQKPDIRTDTEKSEDLLKQVAREIELESCIPDPTEEIEKRLQELKGKDVEPKSYLTLRETPLLLPECSPSDDLCDMSFAKMTGLLEASASRSEQDAVNSFEQLQADPELSSALKDALHRKKNKGSNKSKCKLPPDTSLEEKFSDDSDVDFNVQGTTGGEDNEEVNRIVNMYTARDAKRKLKKKVKQESESSSCSGELSDESSDKFTSDSSSENLSD